MALKLAVLKEERAEETRVAASPETVKKFAKLGFAIGIESSAGVKAGFVDAVYQKAGAQLATDDFIKTADIVLSVQAPPLVRLKTLKKGAILIAQLAPYQNQDLLRACAEYGIDALAMELMPRITRAQSMDVLSSQSNLAGYKAVLDAASVYERALPMMMTAAGTIAPARIFIMGAGVAGLQAIATAKRLGAIVSATDVRKAAAEQVESLGADFIMVETDENESGETKAGYAQEMSESYQKKQAELIANHIATQNIVICTALIPGRPAPELISQAMVERMQAGSVIVDLAAEQGGNCSLSKAGDIITHKGVTIIAHHNVAGRLAASASELYARNLYHFVEGFFDKETGGFITDWDDEIIANIGLTHNGAIIHPAFKQTLEQNEGAH